MVIINHCQFFNVIPIHFDHCRERPGYSSPCGRVDHDYGVGELVDLAATPEKDAYFVNWTGDIGTIADANDPTTTITMNGVYHNHC